MQLEILKSSKLSQTQKGRYHIFSHLQAPVFKRTQNPLDANDADAEMDSVFNLTGSRVTWERGLS